MEDTEVQPLIDNYHRRMHNVDTRFHRYLYDQINWKTRMIGIRGARGVGKTTLMLQHIKENHENIDEVLYASLDDLWFAEHSVMELVDWAYLRGLRRLYLDEVHRWPNWALTLKNIYDSYPDVNIAYTSSSLLQMDNALVDLSRRQTVYTLEGLSFREFLVFDGVADIAPVALEDLLRHHLQLSMDTAHDTKIIPLFNAYLEHGYYPFYKDPDGDYIGRLRATTNTVIESDLPAVEEVTFETIEKVRRLLMIIGRQVPFVPNLSVLWRELTVTNTQGLRMLYALSRAKVLALATSSTKSYKNLSKPDKVFLGNTNLMHALSPTVNKGGERETFFFTQLAALHQVEIPKQGDFLVDSHYLFEVGGKNKTFEQIKDIDGSFLAVDDIEMGSRNRIPLWMFGLLY